MPKYLDREIQTELRKMFDNGASKNRASIELGIAEATVYRYFVKWEALQQAQGTNVFDYSILKEPVRKELDIQARMRGLSLTNFVMALLTTITEDNLFASIIEIEDTNPQKRRLVNNANS